MPRPNIVFVLTDDHAAHAISAYGSPVNTTPSIDRLADEGIRLDAMYCTNAICSPSRASLLTGTYSHVNGVASIYSAFDHETPTFLGVLREAGYQSALFGKWHLGEAPENLPRDVDDWKIFPGQGEYVDPVMIGPSGEELVEGYATDLVTDLALDWLDRRDPDRPFCLLVHHKAPHRPWVPPPQHRDTYPIGSIPEPGTLFDDYSTRSAAARAATMSIADDLTETDVKEPLPPELEGDENRAERVRWNYQRYMRDYLGCVASIDDNVGRLLDELDRQGLADDTIVVYTSDQGFFLGDHGWYDKRFIYDPSLQMPMLIRCPAEIARGGRTDEIMTNVDVAPTLLDFCDLELPTAQGRSFRSVLRGDVPADWPRSMYYRYWEHDDPSHHVWAHYGVRTRTHKLVYFYNEGLATPGASDRAYPPEWELYDLVTDPAELVNVADDPAYATVRAELELELARLQSLYGDRPRHG